MVTGGIVHVGVWPLSEAAEASFGHPDWPGTHPVPQATIESEVTDLEAAATEPAAAGHSLVHSARPGPWASVLRDSSRPTGCCSPSATHRTFMSRRDPGSSASRLLGIGRTSSGIPACSVSPSPDDDARFPVRDDVSVFIDMVIVPPQGPTAERIVDRRDGHSWSVDVAPFHIATAPVTVGEWAGVHGETPTERDPKLPQVNVTWREAVMFCNTLSKLEGLSAVYAVTERKAPVAADWRPHDEPEPDTWHVEWDRAADGYRLPTEAEWQVACRGGTTGPHYANLADIAWYDATTASGPRPVRQKEPNAWGLYDTLGGVWEWCWDLYDEDVYGPYRVIRGGGWSDPHWSCRSGVRRKTNPQASFDDLGFRVARSHRP